MSTEEVKAARVRAPYDYAAVANNFGVLKFTGGTSGTETSHVANAIPDDWRGQWVEIYVTGGDMHYAFSATSSAEVDRAVTATEAGASVKVGAVIPNGASVHVQIPNYGDRNAADGVTYFVRESTALGAVAYMRLAGF